MQYRRRVHLDVWHWCENCSSWPTHNFEETSNLPESHLCRECGTKVTNGICFRDRDSQPLDNGGTDE
jgi:hypothetical protein